MMTPAERHGEFIADPAAQRARLGEPQMVGIRRPPPADQTGLGRHEPEVRTIAIAARFIQREGAFIDVPCHRIVDPRRQLAFRIGGS